MSGGDNWQVGDLALCIGQLQTTDGSVSPIRPGSVHTVTGLVREPFYGLCLYLDILPDGHVADARDFRKIRPHKPDAEDRRTIELLNEKERVS